MTVHQRAHYQKYFNKIMNGLTPPYLTTAIHVKSVKHPHLYYVKDILSQNLNFLKYFLVLYPPVNLLKHNIYALFGIKAVFHLF